MRVATLSHGHPDLSPGGAEIAADALHQALSRTDGIETLHIACAPPDHPSVGTSFVPTTRLDPLTLFRADPTDAAGLVATLAAFGPDVIHLHHILGFGADTLFTLRQRFPNAVIVLTLHEFIAICHNRGQMMRTDGTACERSTPADCARCFPEIQPARFLRRDHALRAMLSLVDVFIAPSAFLARRYVEWGIPASRIIKIENAVAASGPAPRHTTSRRPKRGRFAFFGQITPFKGVDVLLEAVASMPDEDWSGCSLTIHGAHLDRQPEPFQDKVKTLIERAGNRVQFAGAYRNADLPALMAKSDWVVVPSIWWENSPLVIQEAFINARPVIASDIGGMAEKVGHDRNGLTFTTGDSSALMGVLKHASRPETWQKLQSGVVPPVSADIVADWHCRLYKALLQGRQRQSQVA